MKKLPILSLLLVVVTGSIVSCSDVKREPSRNYMPDMWQSRAYETYAPHKNLEDSQIHYTNMPVSGTIKRGEIFPFPLKRDGVGDSSNYIGSKQIVNPLPMPDTLRLKESERLYLIHCGICHGTKLDGNGPLYKDGSGPYAAKPATLVGDAKYENMPEGQMFYSITYGKNLMGPYGSQLSTTQRWQIIHYIKSKQAKSVPKTDTAAPDSTATAAK
ncbi:MAG: cytochrome c [Chitinophagaceae bacterium]|nr:cytochrome c [Chitinophagaceae bacterium]